MRAVILTGHGGLEKLEYREDWKKPVVGKKEVLVRTLACGLNNTDVNTRTAWYSKNVTGATTGESLVDAENKDATWGGKPIHFPRIQGADACGIVEEIGEGADEKLLGHRVLVEIWIRDWKDTLNFEKAGVFGRILKKFFFQFVMEVFVKSGVFKSGLCPVSITARIFYRIS